MMVGLRGQLSGLGGTCVWGRVHGHVRRDVTGPGCGRPWTRTCAESFSTALTCPFATYSVHQHRSIEVPTWCAGATVQAVACDGKLHGFTPPLYARAVANATAEALVKVSATCSSGGPGSIACGLSNGTVNAVARAQVCSKGIMHALACLSLVLLLIVSGM